MMSATPTSPSSSYPNHTQHASRVRWANRITLKCKAAHTIGIFGKTQLVRLFPGAVMCPGGAVLPSVDCPTCADRFVEIQCDEGHVCEWVHSTDLFSKHNVRYTRGMSSLVVAHTKCLTCNPPVKQEGSFRARCAEVRQWMNARYLPGAKAFVVVRDVHFALRNRRSGQFQHCRASFRGRVVHREKLCDEKQNVLEHKIRVRLHPRDGIDPSDIQATLPSDFDEVDYFYLKRQDGRDGMVVDITYKQLIQPDRVYRYHSCKNGCPRKCKMHSLGPIFVEGIEDAGEWWWHYGTSSVAKRVQPMPESKAHAWKR